MKLYVFAILLAFVNSVRAAKGVKKTSEDASPAVGPVPKVSAVLAPSDAPSDVPSDTPSDSPSDMPSDMPSMAPSCQRGKGSKSRGKGGARNLGEKNGKKSSDDDDDGIECFDGVDQVTFNSRENFNAANSAGDFIGLSLVAVVVAMMAFGAF